MNNLFRILTIACLLVAHAVFAEEAVLAPRALETSKLRVLEGVARERPAELPGVRRIEVHAHSQPFYFAQLILPAVSEIDAGETLLVTFDARTTAVMDETGQGLLTVYFQEVLSPGIKPLLRPVTLTSAWETYRFAFRVTKDMSPTALAGELGFGFGGRDQTVELRHVSLTNYGADITPEQLPQTKSTYPGREANATWRVAAAERIERMRKADLNVRVVDAQGAPVAGAQIEVEQQTHAFYFGSAVSIAAINRSSADGDRYREIVSEWFNHAVIESGLKWETWIGEWQVNGDATIEDALQWLNDAELHVKGHVLIWPSFRKMPKAMRAYQDEPALLRSVVNRRITEAAKAYRPYLDEWDVINEPFDNHDVMDILGKESMVEWFQLAQAASPDTPLYINDYGILTGGDASHTPHRQHYAATIQYLLDAGAPLAGIGMQGHFGEHLTPPDTLYQILDRYAQYDLPIQITEFDIDTSDAQLQADYTRDFMTMVFSHPQVNGFVMWGFWEGRHWRPRAALFNKDWTPKPNALAYYDLVFKDWWTREHGSSDTDGEFSTRAYLGTQQVTVTHAGRQVTQMVELDGAGQSVVITVLSADY